jgi:light-regulated signal transduction histidine kinase (bacteriophytochrome)
MLHTYREDLIAQQNRIERLSTFGQLVGSIGHELRNPLGVIESSLYLIKNRAGNDERIQKHVGRIGEQLTIANSIISGLLDMIRDKPLLRERVSLRALIDSAIESLTVPAEVTLTTLGIDDLPPISGDPTQLRQVLHNLIENALQAVGKSGEVMVRASAAEGKIEIAVSDSGPGVDPTIRKRLFEPLISAKPSGTSVTIKLKLNEAATVTLKLKGASKKTVKPGRLTAGQRSFKVKRLKPGGMLMTGVNAMVGQCLDSDGFIPVWSQSSPNNTVIPMEPRLHTEEIPSMVGRLRDRVAAFSVFNSP